MRVGIDATALLGERTGVGAHVAGLVRELARRPDPPELVLAAFSWRQVDALARYAGPGTRLAPRRAPARFLQAAWLSSALPPVEWLTGPVDVFHGPNFVLPPTRRAAGVVTVHDLAFLEHPETVTAASGRYRRLVPAGLRRARAVCTPTRVVAEALIERYGVEPARLVVTPNGLGERWLAGPEPATAAELGALGLPPRFVLFVGNLEPRKNLPVLLSAYRLLTERGTDVPPLVLAGPPGWGPALAPARLPAGTVYTPGYLPEQTLARVVAAAACLVLPSRDEGFGIPPLEALACGVPVVVSDLPALREVLGELPSYVPVGDPDALAAAVAAAAADDGGPAARAARRAHAGRFGWDVTARAAYRAYQLAAERSPERSPE